MTWYLTSGVREMSLNDHVLAGIYLKAVVPLLEDIAEIDEEIRDMVKDWNFNLQFQLPGGLHASSLLFRDGKVEALREKAPGSAAVLTFSDAATLNSIFQGKSDKNPRPNFFGLLHLKKLLKVDSLLKKIEDYLKPDESIFKDPETFSHCVRLNLYAMAYGVKVVGEEDPDMVPLAHNLPQGIVEIRVKNGPAVHLEVINGIFNPFKGRTAEPSAYLEFSDLESAWSMLQGKMDQFAAIGGKKMIMRGLIPLIEGINPILDRLSLYLSD